MERAEAIDSLIERYETQIEELQHKIDNLESEVEKADSWLNAKAFSRPRDLKGEALKATEHLPVPRLQIELTIHNEWRHEWFYALVYQHLVDDLEGKLTMIPMGQTLCNGGHRHDRYDSLEEMISSLPYRDGAHIRYDAEHLRIPAYAIAGGYIWQLPPLKRK